MKRRTKIDFSKHELIIKETEDFTVHWLKKPDTIVHNVKFTNISGVCLVTGDFGNWVFCREFHPSEKGYVSAGYWCEKAQIKSTQETHDFDSEKTAKEIKALLREKSSEEEKDYLRELLERTDDKNEYKMYAYNNCPSGFGYEEIPYEESIKPWLNMIFDAFDTICDRLKKVKK